LSFSGSDWSKIVVPIDLDAKADKPIINLFTNIYRYGIDNRLITTTSPLWYNREEGYYYTNRTYSLSVKKSVLGSGKYFGYIIGGSLPVIYFRARNISNQVLANHSIVNEDGKR